MFIQLTEALALMRQVDDQGQPVPFSLEVTTCDEARGTGGDNLVLENWVLLRSSGPAPAAGRQRASKSQAPRPINEYADMMRRVKNPRNDEVRQIHIRLITSFNGLIVLWQ